MDVDVKNNALPRLMLIDDHVLFRTGMRLILGDGHLKLGEPLEAGSIADALTTPMAIDVVLLDVEMPGISGMDGLALIKRRWPQAAIVMLTANDDPARMKLALARGAQAFVSKTASAEHIRRVVQQALTSNQQAANQKGSNPQASKQQTSKVAALPPLLVSTSAVASGSGSADAAAGAASAATSEPTSAIADAFGIAALSARQLDVLSLMCEGLSNKAIANRLFLSENTIRNHVVAVLRYFDANTRTEAVTLAQRGGVIQLRPVA